MVFPGDIIWYFLIFLVWCKLKKTRAGDACIADDDDGGDCGDGDGDGAVLVGVGFDGLEMHTLPQSTAPKGRLHSTLTNSTVIRAL